MWHVREAVFACSIHAGQFSVFTGLPSCNALSPRYEKCVLLGQDFFIFIIFFFISCVLFRARAPYTIVKLASVENATDEAEGQGVEHTFFEEELEEMEHNIEASHGEVNVVLAADNSPHSDFAFNYYVKEIHRPGYKVHVVHSSDAWASLHHGEEGETISPGHVTEMKLKEDNKIKQMEEKVTKMLQENKIEGVFKVVGGKDSWHEIIKYQQSVGAIMIVVGSRGLNALRRTFMGSVSDSIVHHANCPVLVCRHN